MAEIEQVLQTRAKQVDHEDVVQSLLTKVVHVWNAVCKASAREHVLMYAVQAQILLGHGRW
jgi:tRNA splicing ligase